MRGLTRSRPLRCVTTDFLPGTRRASRRVQAVPPRYSHQRRGRSVYKATCIYLYANLPFFLRFSFISRPSPTCPLPFSSCKVTFVAHFLTPIAEIQPVGRARSEMLKGIVRLEFPVAMRPTYFQMPRVPRSCTQFASGSTLLQLAPTAALWRLIFSTSKMTPLFARSILFA
jgi:hypothetical protein